MSNPYTEFSRSQKAVIDEAVQLIDDADIPAVAFHGTSHQALARVVSEALVKSQGTATAIVCYGGSRFANFPRVEQTVSILIVSTDTRVKDGHLDALDASRVIGAAIDDHITDVSGDGSYPFQDKWEAVSEEVLDLETLRASAAVVLTFTVKQYS